MKAVMQKSPRWESKKLRESAKEAPMCFGCGRYNDGSVVLAHANWQEYGKGVGVKVSDIFGALMCPICHASIDGERQEARREYWRHAHIKTLQWWVQNGYLKA